VSEHGATPHQEPETREGEPRTRLPGIAYPVLGAIFGAAMVWSFSRVLLAASEFDLTIAGHTFRLEAKDVAVAVALFTAANVLVGAALVAYGRRVRGRTVALPLLVVAAAVVLVAGGVGLALGDRPGEEEAGGGPGPPESSTVVASGLQFDPTQLSFTSGAEVTLTLDNRDAGIDHNLSIYRDEGATQPIFQGEIFKGPATKAYTFTLDAPPGSYLFHCDVHPQQMKGSVEVRPPGGGEGPGGGPSLSAEGLAFAPTTLTVPAGAPFSLRFSNQDANIAHNVAIFAGADATAPNVFRGDVITGPAEIEYHVDPLPAGTYFFHCDVHPDTMTGTITVK